MQRLQSGLSQGQIALRCECNNFETVYLKDDKAGAVIVSDDHQTFKYLGTEKDSTYVALDAVNMEGIRRVCDELGVQLQEAPSDGFPSIEYLVNPEEVVGDAVLRVAKAVDRVFNLVMRNDLK
jgi:hypothetical protein